MRPPKPTFERVKLPLLLAAFIFLSEYVDPLPFYVTFPARISVFLLILFVLREFHHARLEVDKDWNERTDEITGWWRTKSRIVPRETWLKARRVVIWMAVGWAFGSVLNILTDKCDSAIQCAMLAPRMAIENLPTFLQFALYVSMTLFQLGIMFYAMVKVGSFKVVMPGTVGVTFDDVWGQDAAKEKVLEQVKLLEDSEEVEEAGGYMPRGILLYGPPGTGKTYLAKAAANYSSKPLILVPPGAFQATFVGINLLKVWTLFRNIRKLAHRYGGVIVFIDEIDSLGSRGGNIEQGAVSTISEGCVPYPVDSDDPTPIVVGGGMQMGTLEAFLSAMDGMEEPRGLLNRILVFLGFKPLRPIEYKYLMMGATNMMERLDPALLRAGRFGRKIHVSYPKIEGRLRTYEGYLKKVKNDLSKENIDWAARSHAKVTSADIKDIVNESLLITYRDAREGSGVVHFRDLMKAMLWVKFGESDGPFDREAGRWAVAVHEAGHAVVFHHLNRDRQNIWFATIEQHGKTGGMVAPTPIREDWLLMRSELLADIQVSLASRVAEKLILGESSNGHAGDGRAATERAGAMVQLGLVRDIGAYNDTKWLRNSQEIVLKEALEAVQELLTSRVDEIQAVAHLLEEKGTVPGDEIHKLLDEMNA